MVSDEIEKIISKHSGDRGGLIAILEEVQAKEGYLPEDWNSHTIETTNTVKGEPVYYFNHGSNFTVPAGAGQVILTNCSWITIENQSFSSGGTRIKVVYSSNITIENNEFLNNHCSISIRNSIDCNIKNNTCWCPQ